MSTVPALPSGEGITADRITWQESVQEREAT